MHSYYICIFVNSYIYANPYPAWNHISGLIQAFNACIVSPYKILIKDNVILHL